MKKQLLSVMSVLIMASASAYTMAPDGEYIGE